MKKQIEAGSFIDFHILRDGKVIHEQNNLHNIWNTAFMNSNGANNLANIIGGATIVNSLYVYSYTTTIKRALTGTWARSGTTISRSSGSDTISASSDYYVFADGTRGGYYISGSTTSATVSRSGTVTAQALDEYRVASLSALAGYSASATFTGSNSHAPTYSNGITTLENVSGSQCIFAPAVTPYTLRRLYVSLGGINTFSAHYDLPSPVSILAGDIIVVTGFRNEIRYGSYLPVNFAVSPISGVTSACVYQRLFPTLGVGTEWNGGTSPNRIFLVTTPNAVTVPNMPSSSIAPGTITAAQTITALAFNTVPTYTNDFVGSSYAAGATTGAVSNIKQIYWGDTTRLHGVIEFTTPQTIAANKGISVGTTMSIVPGLA